MERLSVKKMKKEKEIDMWKDIIISESFHVCLNEEMNVHIVLYAFKMV